MNGLPALAQELQSKGRFGDSMLVHMTPGEVGGLQSLAMRHGGSLTINPETGLPESFFLAALLPALAGAAGTALLPTAATAALGGFAVPAAVGGITALATGSIEKGLMAGLGAYSGAGLAEGLMAAGGAGGAAAAGGAETLLAAGAGAPGAAAADIAASTAAGAMPTATGSIGQLAAAPQATQSLLAAPGGMGAGAAGQGIVAPTGAGFNLGMPSAQAAQTAAGGIQGSTGLIPGAPSFAGVPGVTQTAGGIGGLPGAGGGIGVTPQMQLAQQTGIQTADTAMSPMDRMMSGVKNIVSDESDGRKRFMDKVGGVSGLASKAAGVVSPFFAEDEAEEGKAPDTRIRPYAFDFRGPDTQEGFQYRTGVPGESTSEIRYFTPTFTPMGSFKAGTEPGPSFYGTPTAEQYALYSQPKPKELAAGGIAGLKKGRFLQGPGDGMSDSIPATINGTQPARLTDGEFVVPADVVSHLGNGSSKAGAEKLHAMMDRIRKVRTGKRKQAPEVKAERFMPA